MPLRCLGEAAHSRWRSVFCNVAQHKRQQQQGWTLLCSSREMMLVTFTQPGLQSCCHNVPAALHSLHIQEFLSKFIPAPSPNVPSVGSTSAEAACALLH
jgi:hypothetical protein